MKANEEKASYTPGPWDVEEDGNGNYTIVKIDEQRCLRSHVARCIDAALCPEHGSAEANAKLIASAPELAERLRDVLAMLELLNRPGTNDPIEACVYKAREALKKAGCL